MNCPRCGKPGLPILWRGETETGWICDAHGPYQLRDFGEGSEECWWWVIAEDCRSLHPYGEEGWRPGPGGQHEHRVDGIRPVQANRMGRYADRARIPVPRSLLEEFILALVGREEQHENDPSSRT